MREIEKQLFSSSSCFKGCLKDFRMIRKLY